MATAKSYTLILEDGNLDGVIIIEGGGSSIVIVSAPREQYSKLASIDEAKYSGIYFLLSDETVYVGQSTTTIKSRLDAHYKNKEFWDRVIFVAGKGNGFSGDLVNYLECKFIELAKNVGTAELDNQNSGNINVNAARDVKVNGDNLIKEILLLIGVIGIEVFKPKKRKRSKNRLTNSNPNKQKSSGYNHELRAKERETRTLNRPEIISKIFYAVNPKGKHGAFDAKMKVISENEFRVLSGSKIASGQTLQTDRRFNSLSSAASFVFGSTANGWIFWKNADGVKIYDLAINSDNAQTVTFKKQNENTSEQTPREKFYSLMNENYQRILDHPKFNEQKTIRISKNEFYTSTGTRYNQHKLPNGMWVMANFSNKNIDYALSVLKDVFGVE